MRGRRRRRRGKEKIKETVFEREECLFYKTEVK
jgi:hypothetical protein